MIQPAELHRYTGLDYLKRQRPDVRDFEVPWDEALTQLEAIITAQLTTQQYTGPRGSALFLLKEMREAEAQMMMLAVVANEKRTQVAVIPLPYSYSTPPGVEKADKSIFEETLSTGTYFNLTEQVQACLKRPNPNTLRDPDVVFVMRNVGSLSGHYPLSVGRPMVNYLHPQHKQWLDETKEVLNSSK